MLCAAAHNKKNWLFVGDAMTGECSAVHYTIIESCRRRGINPFEYLRDVFTRLPKMTNWELRDTDLTPAGWLKERCQHVALRAAS